ncbi:hypothetical protein E2562_038515 [Oryza meyeriana var. granulata]|uniref:Uncharacterized protein n=1 Tax=Oryza meyeriana var. granulata TaxID=110450 RepID=A0A6G1EUC9_9ORYZ|nr:hypothetical protein E2562_038515 [Oryza meyeriana var. granulata]
MHFPPNANHRDSGYRWCYIVWRTGSGMAKDQGGRADKESASVPGNRHVVREGRSTSGPSRGGLRSAASLTWETWDVHLRSASSHLRTPPPLLEPIFNSGWLLPRHGASRSHTS